MHKSVKKKKVRVLCTSCDDVFICTKFFENILNGFRAMERSRFVTDRHTDSYGKDNISYLDGSRHKTICLPKRVGECGGERIA